MGTIRITGEGIKIGGRIDVVKTLYASTMASKKVCIIANFYQK